MEANMYVDEEMTQRDPEIGEQLEKMAEEIKAAMTGPALKFYEREFAFFRKVTNISGIIRPYPKGPQRNAECLKALKEVELLPGVYLPSNPDSVVVGIDYQSGTPMQSAVKAPFLARFSVVRCGTEEVEKMNTHSEEALTTLSSRLSPLATCQAAIFKVGDDVRQDMLALQIILLFRDVFHSVGLSLYLVPYRVVATACGCGVIEVVPDSKSRDKIGKQTQASLRGYFHSVYGSEDSIPYQEARANFVRSMAAYSLVSYLLQIKDRHNGNIMVDKQGHIIHIDFGFLFESSPGGNLGFEPDLKLTEEMLEVMDGKKSDTYRWFLQLCVQGYLCLRPYQEQVVSLVSLMLDTGFPCFRRNSIEELRARFRPGLNEREAAKTIIEVVEYSCLNFRTKTYDLIQDVQQNIYYHKETD